MYCDTELAQLEATFPHCTAQDFHDLVPNLIRLAHMAQHWEVILVNKKPGDSLEQLHHEFIAAQEMCPTCHREGYIT